MACPQPLPLTCIKGHRCGSWYENARACLNNPELEKARADGAGERQTHIVLSWVRPSQNYWRM
ncbi:hypothetical protein BCAR13_400012 [Paraburkholderia caribensis]|nr:hypothetical protein BCAR13_400012 [Paraburkholderia caribensis]